MRKLLAIWITKLLITAGKLGGKKGSSTPGRFALLICPDILKYLSSQIKENIVVVCGTNGKTTTNNLLYSVLLSQGKSVVCNNVGANMLEGVTTAFVNSANIWGRINADYASIEIDEISTVKVFEHFLPDYMIITNLFRDQLDRYGEIDITIEYLTKSLAMSKNTTLILNADDPLVVALGKKCGNKAVYFGVSEDVGISLNETKEGRFCSFCGNELTYNYYHYSQLGDYVCSKCGFQRPEVSYAATNVNIESGICFDVDNRNICVNYRGFYNIYNILAAYSVCSVFNLNLDNLNKTLSNYKPQIGRMESFYIGKQVIFNLSKNPAGFNQAISTVKSDGRTKDVVVVINDNAQDGKDISWIWDVDFERLKDVNVNTFTASGIRHNDVCVRFKYADFENFEDISDVKTAIIEALKSNAEVLYVLVNYTALFSTQDILKELEGKM